MIKLYSYYRSSCSYRVRIALNLKNLEYEIIPVHLVADGGQQFLSQFERLNPAHRVPVLEHAGKVISQSVAIIEYLEAIFRESHLYPTTPYDRAICRQLCETINSDIQPLQNIGVLKKLVQDHGLNEEDKDRWIQHWISLGFETYETIVKETAGEFSMGDTPTAADCFLIPQVYNAFRFNVEMSLFPTIQRIYDNCAELPAFNDAHPNHQPDTPENLRD